MRAALVLVLAAALLLATNYWRTCPLGLIAGTLAGCMLPRGNPERISTAAQATWWKPVLRMLTGFPVLLLLVWVTRILSSAAGQGTLELVLVCAGFTLCGLWISAGAFYFFRLIRI